MSLADEERPEMFTEAPPSAVPVLNYSRLVPPPPPVLSGPLLPLGSALLPFAVGAWLPFLLTALLVREPFVLSLGFFDAWGETGALVVAVKIRRSVFRIQAKNRSWWVNLIAGSLNTLAMFCVVRFTTARDPFWPLLDQGGSMLMAIALTGALSAFVGIALSPRAE